MNEYFDVNGNKNVMFLCIIHLRNEWFSGDLFVPRYDSFPMNVEKKTLIPYIYNVSSKDSF